MKDNNVASSLRWRARISKEGEAMSVPFDDSANDGIGNFSSENENKSRVPAVATNKELAMLIWKAMKVERMKVLALNLTAIILVTGSVWSLQVAHSFLIAVMATLNVSFSLLALWQQRALRQSASIRRIHNETRHKTHNLRLQNERLYRQFISLDAKIDRIHQIKLEFQRRIRGQHVNTDELVQTLQSYKQVHVELQKQLQRQVEEHVLRAVLTSDQDHNWVLSASELEKLIHRLRALPGIVHFNEQHLRAILVDNNNSQQQHNSNGNNKEALLVNVVRLLRQISNDVGVSAASSKTSTSSPASTPTRRSRGTNGAVASYKNSRSSYSTVFEFNTQSILTKPQKQSQQQQQLLLLPSPPQKDLHHSSKMTI